MSTHRSLSGSAVAFQQAGNFTELAANLLNHVHGRIADRGHGDGGDQERHQAADEQTDQNFRVADVQVEGRVGDGDGLHVGGDNSQRGQCRRTDGEAFADGRSGVAQFVQRVGDLAGFFAQTAHLGDTAGVVRNRSVGVDGHGEADGCQHAESGDANPVEARHGGGNPDDAANGQHRDRPLIACRPPAP